MGKVDGVNAVKALATVFEFQTLVAIMLQDGVPGREETHRLTKLQPSGAEQFGDKLFPSGQINDPAAWRAFLLATCEKAAELLKSKGAS